MIRVLGVGNILFKDEGFGVRFAERYQEELEKQFENRVEVVEGGTQTLPLLQLIEYSKHLFIIDAVNRFKDDQKPGDILYFTHEDIMNQVESRIKITTHSGGIHELLSAAELESTVPENILLIGVIPWDFSGGMEMTGDMEKMMPVVRDILVEKIKEVLPN
jgi:hydrogenase maturation protease